MLQGTFDYAQRIGPVFGSEKISILLYSLVRMRQPEHIIELGCGTGATAFCMAQALRENGHGKLLSVDNEQAWPQLAAKLPFQQMGMQPVSSMAAYIGRLTKQFGLSECLAYHKTELPPFPVPKDELDFLFVDYNHRPENVIKILATYLPIMSRSSIIAFDSAATYFPTYQLLENLERYLAKARVPEILLHDQDEQRRSAVVSLVERSRIKLMHFVERDKDEQNSLSALFIEPLDLLPADGAAMRMV